MQTRATTFIINRDDLNVDPVALVTDGLKIGRLPSCELVLNHPTVSRLHAGVTEADGRFYLYNFSHSSGTTLNGRVVATETADVLADGDVVQVGPFFLSFARAGDALSISVTLEVATHVGDAEARGDAPAAPAPPARPELGQISEALNVFWAKRKREAGKMDRLSPMQPHKPARVLGKARFNWTPTRDLVRPWPFSVFVWGFALVAVCAAVAGLVYAQAYAPAPISEAHTRATIRTQPAIAGRPNAGSCTSCHTLTGSVEQNCADCHRAEGFVATTTEPHRAAGVGCTSCHVEHQGTEYRPAVASLQTCLSCHNDANPKTYNGRRVGTPHGGAAGYPVVEGRWAWGGPSAEEWATKPAALRELAGRIESGLNQASRPGRDPLDLRRSAIYHALHLNRVRTVEGLQGSRDGQVSCSTCHQTFSPIDRETPRATCARCHNGDRGGKFERVLAADQPNCISCHVQHPQGRRSWGHTLLAGRGSGNDER
jgi:FHA domain